MNAIEAKKVSIQRKLPPKLEKVFNKEYDERLEMYIAEINFYIMLYSSWGIFWCPIPRHHEPNIFLAARDHFESLGFQWTNETTNGKHDEWHLKWFEATEKA